MFLTMKLSYYTFKRGIEYVKKKKKQNCLL